MNTPDPTTTALVPIAPALELAPDCHPALVYLASLAPGSRPAMSAALERVAAIISNGRSDLNTLPWGALRFQHVAAVRSTLAAELAPATVNRHLAAVRGALRTAWRLGQLAADDLARACDVGGVQSERLPAGRALAAGELRALFQACADGTPAGARDAALLTLLYGSGLRRAEAVALELADFDPATGALTVRSGKGRKDRLVYVTNGALACMGAWIKVRGLEPGALLVPVRKGGRLELRHLTPVAVNLALASRAERAGVPKFSPHDLRRTFVGDLLDLGADVSCVQQLAGHANVATTLRYDRRPEAAKLNAAKRLHVPYAG